MAPWLGFLERRLDLGSDPRQGSAREGSSSSGTLSTAGGNKTASAAKLGTTFAPLLVYFAVCIIIFLVLRPRCKRVYAPRTINALRHPELPSPALPSGWFNWIKPFAQVSDIFVLNHASLDGFFFLRFIKVLRNICLAGCIIIYPVLLPIHITGGNGNVGLEILTMGNVKDPYKFYAHVLVSWLFFGFVIYTIVRECIYYVNLRQAYLSSPYYAHRLSSRTILLTCVPRQYLDQSRLRKLYGDSVRRVFIPRTSKTLANLVKEREQTAERLEKAEVELIKKANAARQKHYRALQKSKPKVTEVALKPGPPPTPSGGSTKTKRNIVTTQTHGSDTTGTDEQIDRGDVIAVDIPGPALYLDNDLSNDGFAPDTSKPEDGEVDDQEYTHPYGLADTLPDVRGSVAAQWIPVEARPHHRPIGNYGRRVDTIRWTRNRLKQLNLQIYKLRRQIKRDDSSTLSAAFIEFDSQESAQAAQQVLAHHRPLQMSDRILGIRPDEVIWGALRMPWWERIMRRFAILALVVAAIIFFAIPSALIGFISNISNVTNLLPFLSFINKLPKVVVEFVESFIPPLALSLLMALVPIFLRFCAAQAGAPSKTMAELFTQNAYFAFQVVQVFLITTLTSAASSALQKVIEDPLGSRKLLAENIPKASNFYLSYIMIQCLASSGLRLIQVFSFLRHYIVAKITDLPRSRFKTWRSLQPPRWGGVFPIYTNMAVIALTYSLIAPLVLVFAAGGMAVVRIVWKYNLLYVLDSNLDSKGLFYPQALLHLIIGLYIAQVCLIGLFALNVSIGPVVLMVVFLVFTVLVHISLKNAIAPLLVNLPQTLNLEEEIREEEKEAAARAQAAQERLQDPDAAGAASAYYDVEQAFGDEEDDLGEVEVETDDNEHDPASATSRGVEGAGSVKAALTEWLKSKFKAKAQTEADESGLTETISKVKIWAGKGDKDRPPGFLYKWLHPAEYEDFLALRNLIPPDSMPNIEYPDDYKNCKYMPPEIWLPKQTLWIPKDDARVSRQEVAHTSKYTPITDRGATLNEKGQVVVDLDNAPIQETSLLL